MFGDLDLVRVHLHVNGKQTTKDDEKIKKQERQRFFFPIY